RARLWPPSARAASTALDQPSLDRQRRGTAAPHRPAVELQDLRPGATAAQQPPLRRTPLAQPQLLQRAAAGERLRRPRRSPISMPTGATTTRMKYGSA